MPVSLKKLFHGYRSPKLDKTAVSLHSTQQAINMQRTLSHGIKLPIEKEKF